jgi:hypothetical protein
MNLLLDRAPISVSVGGRQYPIDADFRNCIRFEQLMFDSDVPDNLRGAIALHLFYPEIPPDTAGAFRAILWLYSCGEQPKEEINKSGGNGKRIYDYEYDSGYIYAAFLADYGIDLESIEYLHWWKFRALFASLRQGNMIVKIMGYRAADTRKMKGEEKKHYREMQRLYALPRPAGEQEKLDAINDVLLHGGDVSRLIRK